ncbi:MULTISPECIES: DUF6086 family protein [Amycolatopsis]|uniref:Uncharacterized protein n=1 Tax=Amycolatopsis dendrobii TaxID=2760662 RepID=A0A7W3ZGH4_9PSEU|nr:MULTISPECIES: DUF6086 family protein [Amycolatopsis]MBB1160167.1 hypothetical protein [Amycolatopsis dendrobii]UKD55413.1 DUF6086 family protein [Amycolatopsis sp. FU40]
MSYIFDVGDETVWSPALRVGRLFVSMAETLAVNFDIDLRTAGFTATASDFCSVDPPRLALFVRAMLDSSVLTHSEYRELARGFLGICLAMLEWSGRPAEDVPPDLAEARDAVRMRSR